MKHHHYLSTACFHGNGTYCRAHTGLSGLKNPAECKWCAAGCVCSCHTNPDQPCTAPPDAHLTDLRRELDKALAVLIDVGHYLTSHAEMNAALHLARDRVMYSPLHARVTHAVHSLHRTLDASIPADETGD